MVASSSTVSHMPANCSGPTHHDTKGSLAASTKQAIAPLTISIARISAVATRTRLARDSDVRISAIAGAADCISNCG